MKCERIKEIIATDYIDGQLDEKLKRQVQAHLGICSQCLAYEESLRKVAVEPFKNLEELSPPDFVWERIRVNIEEGQAQHRGSILTFLKNSLQPFFHIPRPAPLFAAIAVAILVITVTSAVVSLNSVARIKSYFQEQEDFLNSLEANPENSQAGSGSLGTTIEEYLF